MSVVNKMLRDLDTRRQAQLSTPQSANYVQPKSSRGLWIAVLSLGLLSLIIASYSVYLIGQASTDGSLKQSPNANEILKGDQYAAQNASQNKFASTLSVVSDVDEDTPSNIKLSAYLPSEIPEKMQSFTDPVMSSSTNIDMSPRLVTKTTSPAQSKPFSVVPSDGAKSQLSSLRAKAYMASQENDEARVVLLLNEILLIAPQEMRTRKQLAALLFSKNQLSEAKNVLSQGILQTPADSSLRLMLSRIFFRLGDLSQAFTVLAEHPYSALANDDLLSFRAALAEKTGNYDIAQQDYLVLVQRNPNDAKWWLGLGVSQDKQKLAEQAISSYQQAQSLNQLSQQVDTFVAKRIQLLARRS
jgi:tetratricopeptide (TPR) repeat protein